MDSGLHILVVPITATTDFHGPSFIIDLGLIYPSFLRSGKLLLLGPPPALSLCISSL